MNNFQRPLALAAVAAGVLALSACAADPYYNAPPPVYSAPVAQAAPAYVTPPVYTEIGRVSNIEVMQQEGRRAPSGAGAIIGGVLGAVVGNQIGGGAGRALATGAGVIGGAVVGNNIESNQRGPIVQSYRISVQVENGGYKAFDVPSPGDLRIGDRVRIQNNQLQRI